jgi:cobalt-zinc-cadmium efflux system protein
MAAGHAHSHAHSHAQGVNERRVGLAALLTGAFVAVEVIGGLVSGSLALLADAGHMVADFAALGLAWFAFRLQRRPADWKRTYGFDRLQVLVAFGNALALFAIAGWVVWEAVRRLGAPAPVDGAILSGVALAGLAVNLGAFVLLRGADRENLNVRGAALHVIGDLLGSAAALAAGGVILATGWTPIDPLLSVLVALIILFSAWSVARQSGHILLEGVPAGVDPRAIAPDLEGHVEGVEKVHHVHVWSITQERPMATLQVRIRPGTDAEGARAGIKRRLAERFDLCHVTVEIEHGAGAA